MPAWRGPEAAVACPVGGGGAIAPDVVQSVSVGAPPGLSFATLVLASPVAAGDSLSIMAQGAPLGHQLVAQVPAKGARVPQ